MAGQEIDAFGTIGEAMAFCATYKCRLMVLEQTGAYQRVASPPYDANTSVPSAKQYPPEGTKVDAGALVSVVIMGGVVSQAKRQKKRK